MLYAPTPEFRHRDHLGRIYVGPQQDMYLNPIDGSLVPLVVQASELVLESGGNTWERGRVGSGNDFMRLATMPFVRYRNAAGDTILWTLLSTAAWWLISCTLLFLTVRETRVWLGI